MWGHLKSQTMPTPQEGGGGKHHQGGPRWQSSKAASASDIQLKKKRFKEKVAITVKYDL